MFHHYHFDPLDTMYNPLPENPTKEEMEEYQRLSYKMLVRGFLLFVVLLIIMFVSLLFTGCATQKVVSSDISNHRVADMMDRMDSLMHSKTVVQQDSTWRQEILRQFQSIREKSDTSHTLVVDSAGKVIREKIVINNVRETTSETEREQLTVISRRLEVMDSTISLMRKQIQHSDSLLQSRRETVEVSVDKQLSWFQQMRLWLGNLVLVALAVVAVWWFARKKTWWLALLRKII